MDLTEMQKRVYQNKVNKGFNITDVPKEFCYLYGEVAEAYDAYLKEKDDLGEELADIAIYLLGLSEILGLDISKTIDNLQPHSTARLGLTPTNTKDAMDIIKKYADNDKYLLHFGTKPKPNTAAESTILPEYNLVSSHAYIIKGYNPTSQMVTIVNPHNTAVVTEIPIGKLIQHIAHLDLTNIE